MNFALLDFNVEFWNIDTVTMIVYIYVPSPPLHYWKLFAPIGELFPPALDFNLDIWNIGTITILFYVHTVDVKKTSTKSF